MSSKVGFAGDWHGNVNFALRAIDHLVEQGCTRIVQVGDFGFWPGSEGDAYLNVLNMACERHDIDLYVVRGNHDDYDRWGFYEPDDNGFGVVEALDIESEQVCVQGRLHYVPDGLAWFWEGVAFGALGGAASIDREYRLRKEPLWGKTWWPEEMILPEHVVDLVNATDGYSLDVLCTHEGPSWTPVEHHADTDWLPVYDKARSAICVTLIDLAANLTRPTLHVHGHHHQYGRKEAPNGGEVVALAADVNYSVEKNTYILHLDSPAEHHPPIPKS